MPPCPGENYESPRGEAPSSPGTYESLIFKTVVMGPTDGVTINSAFPIGRKFASFIFPSNSKLIAVQLNATIINVTVTNIAGAFIATNNADQISLDGSPDVLLAIASLQNSIIGTPAPANRSVAVNFNKFTGKLMQAGSAISIYAFAPLDVNTSVAAIATFSYIDVGGR